MKPNINSVELHPQLSNDGHPVDDVGAGSLWPLLQAVQNGLLLALPNR
jgi:hypothetical protein